MSKGAPYRGLHGDSATDLFADADRDGNFFSRRTGRQRVLLVTLALKVIVSVGLLVVASQWEHWFGIGWAAGSLIATTMLLLATRRWSKTQTHDKAACGLVTLSIVMFLFTTLLFLVPLLAPDPAGVTSFPSECLRKAEAPYDCTRVAPTNPMRGQGLSPPVFNATVDKVHDAVVSILSNLPSTAELITNRKDFVHARILTQVMGYPDDVYVAIGCQKLWVQSQSRLGRGDFGVNEERVKKIIADLKAYKGVGDVSTKQC